jgi:hypothetical protein
MRECVWCNEELINFETYPWFRCLYYFTFYYHGQVRTYGKLFEVNNQKLKCTIRAKSLTFKKLNDINNPDFLPKYLIILNRLYKFSSVILTEIFDSQKANVLRIPHCMNDNSSTHKQQSIKQSMSQ